MAGLGARGLADRQGVGPAAVALVVAANVERTERIRKLEHRIERIAAARYPETKLCARSTASAPSPR